MSDQAARIVGAQKLSVVLVEPDIPQNTGNIARLCYATGCELVLVRPFGFRLTDASLQRAGMDYWKNLEPIILADIDEFMEWAAKRRVYYLSAHSDRNYAQVSYQPGDALVFGSESRGLPAMVLAAGKAANSLITLPMIEPARCLNVSSAAAATVYEALRQISHWSSSPPENG
ncbi:MAG: tRNA (uridine(34)/cytosine(34)/5-carboxymethylaminomethyluridine(34)-2'-O)-methyltransferase TrmL [Candidatus Riflebacteria bacterium HGW-Riflebacteria-2]|jgi:tRNA (cytidine/uridine-2'-O-)-methyltransferase|nr:MAG: tRNA (uridine(34)/cytosine(34)/5-carboxymethylaminomethyluridine(34)-2'-O)-methyltransferase TrmL [Candidatus Riflebacteria bacterium HGW-Riflebacteria-2]